MTVPRLGTLRAALLIELLDGNLTGLGLIARAQARGFRWFLPGRVYPALREMERQWIVRSVESEPIEERGWRPRRCYWLTDAGRGVALALAEVERRLREAAT